MKTPDAYMHGVGVFVPAHVAAWLQQHARLHEVYERHRPDDIETIAVLMAISRTARDFNTAGSARGTIQAPQTEPAPASDVLVGTGVAAGRLGISDRAVRKALSDGRLTGQLIDARWRVSTTSIDNFTHRRTV